MDTFYNAAKDVASLINKRKKDKDKDEYIKELENKCEDLAHRYDSLWKEYQDMIKKPTLNLTSEHLRLLKKFKFFSDMYCYKINEEEISIKERIRLYELNEHNYVQNIGYGDYRYTNEKKTEILKLINNVI